MKKAFPHFTITELCRILSVSSSSFYSRKVSRASDESLVSKIKKIAHDSGYTYGKRRIHNELKAFGISISLSRVSKLMKSLGIVVRFPKEKHYYPNSGLEVIYAPNLLKRQFYPSEHNTQWVTDVTYIRSHQGWSYLACVLDLATKEVVGYALSQSPDTHLTLAALDDAIMKKSPKTGSLMVHSDQGCHFSSHAYRNRLKTLGITQSMSRRGNCWDNAVMERFFRSLKSERLNYLKFINHQSVVVETERYIRFYNYKRRHSSIGYLTPHEMYQKKQKVA